MSDQSFDTASPAEEPRNTQAQAASFDDEPTPEQAAVDVASSSGAQLDAELAGGEPDLR